MKLFVTRRFGVTLIAVLMAFVLSACGGGGGTDTPPPDDSGGGGGGTPNAPPTADAGDPFSAREGTTVSLTGGGSDSDGTLASFAWRQLDGEPVSLSQGGGSDTATFDVPDIDADTSASFELTVTDDDGASDTDQVEVTLLANFTVAGTVFAASGIDNDGDVNDPETPLSRNDTFDTAQAINNPVLLGGFSNRQGRGDASGQLEAIGDPDDFFVIDAVANQVVSLFIEAERTAVNDLDLVLYDADRNQIDESASISSFEQLIIPEDGRYFVQVLAFNGASNYVLSLGQAAAPTMAPSDRLVLSDPFVVGEALVRFQEEAFSAGGGVTALSSEAAMRVMGGGEDRMRRLDTSAWATTAQQGTRTGTKALPGQAQVDDLQARIDTLHAVKALRARSDVISASPNYLYQPLLTPDDEFYSLQWHYPSISLPAAWDLTTGDSDIIVAVIDTGVLTAHPDFVGKLTPGFDFISDSRNARDGDGIDPDPNDPGDLVSGGSSSFHGTHVAGTVGALTGNGSGVAGVGWDTRIMPLRALGQFGGSEFDINQAIRFAAGLENDSGTLPDQPAAIINLSLGGPSFSAATQALFDEVRAAGVIVVAAAGNSATSAPSYPAAYDGVVSVSSVDINKNLASYSNFGSTIDIAAPGGSTSSDVNGDGFGDGVLSAIGDDSGGGSVNFGYGFLQGTSMAAPHVAGVAALMKAVFPALTPAVFDDLIVSGIITEDLGTTGRDDSFGQGLISAYDAVIAAIDAAGGELPEPTPALVTTPSALNFGVSITTQTVNLTNGGNGDLLVDAPVVSPVVSWLDIDASMADPDDGTGDYLFRVDRSELSAGTFQTEVMFASNGGNAVVRVIMQVSDGDTPTGNAGNQFIILINDETGEVIEQAEPGILIDSAPYAFENVPPGVYIIVGGTDNDSDGFICDAAESCGAFPVLDPLELPTIVIEADALDLDYVVTFNADLASPSPEAAAAGSDGVAGDTSQVRQKLRRVIGTDGIPLRRGANVLDGEDVSATAGEVLP